MNRVKCPHCGSETNIVFKAVFSDCVNYILSCSNPECMFNTDFETEVHIQASIPIVKQTVLEC